MISAATALDLRMPGRVVLGAGGFAALGEVAGKLGTRALLVTGRASLAREGLLARAEALLHARGVSVVLVAADGEPSVAVVDEAVRAGRAACCDLVVAAGGGSALDLGKAAAGLIPNAGSIRDYLEGVGTGRVMERSPLPFVAVPTTAGTGSEATRNAVIGGAADGFKKSFRDPRLTPAAAIVDAELSRSCPPELSAACGLDALTQLLESLTSLRATPLTDALALEGLSALGRGLPRAVEHGGDLEARSLAAYAAFLSGVTLSHAGLGAVHGLASPVGAACRAPHGVICARLLVPVTEANLRGLAAGRGPSGVAGAYARGIAAVGSNLADFRGRFPVPGLARYGLSPEAFPAIVAGATGGSMKTNPVHLTNEELAAALARAL